MKQNQEQSEHVKLLSEMLEDSERERAKLRNELESMNSQVQYIIEIVKRKLNNPLTFSMSQDANEQYQVGRRTTKTRN